MAMRVNPTRMELTRLKRRLKTAVRGHKLLKDKRDEMIRQFIIYIKRNHQLRMEVEDELMRALARFARAKAYMGAQKALGELFCPSRAASFEIGKRNVMSVDVPVIKHTGADDKIELPYGFAHTSGELDASVMEVVRLLPLMAELAQVEKSCNLLANEIEKTRRRVNALEYVMIPETEDAIKYITMKLEENDRASLVRLMKAKEMLMEA
ncbi:MAG: V-type ATP synthase subunit D [Acidaminococcales bacterium]|jgi:V/A-type H+-transporting ATPase subunit D|nr:V-type ATP synthase subunit D [Acidaminococcales bacterium]